MDIESSMDKEEMGMRSLVNFNKLRPPQIKIKKLLLYDPTGSEIIRRRNKERS